MTESISTFERLAQSLEKTGDDSVQWIIESLRRGEMIGYYAAHQYALTEYQIMLGGSKTFAGWKHWNEKTPAEWKRWNVYSEIKSGEYSATKDETRGWIGKPVIDFLKDTRLPPRAKLSAAFGLVDDSTLIKFSVWCARKALECVGDPDQCIIDALDVCEQYANGAADIAALFSAYESAHAVIAGLDLTDTVHIQAGATVLQVASISVAVPPFQVAHQTSSSSVDAIMRAKSGDIDASVASSARDEQLSHLIELLEEKYVHP